MHRSIVLRCFPVSRHARIAIEAAAAARIWSAGSDGDVAAPLRERRAVRKSRKGRRVAVRPRRPHRRRRSPDCRGPSSSCRHGLWTPKSGENIPFRRQLETSVLSKIHADDDSTYSGAGQRRFKAHLSSADSSQRAGQEDQNITFLVPTPAKVWLRGRRTVRKSWKGRKMRSKWVNRGAKSRISTPW